MFATATLLICIPPLHAKHQDSSNEHVSPGLDFQNGVVAMEKHPLFFFSFYFEFCEPIYIIGMDLTCIPPSLCRTATLAKIDANPSSVEKVNAVRDSHDRHYGIAWREIFPMRCHSHSLPDYHHFRRPNCHRFPSFVTPIALSCQNSV